ncbi:hypothetical protein D3C87_145810 [compost metagenome]
MLNNKGMTLIQTMVGMGLAVVTMVGIAGIFAQTIGASKEVDIQALIDTRHIDVMHRAGSLQFLRDKFVLSATGTVEGNSKSLADCLRGKGSNCTGHAGPQKLLDTEGDFNSGYSLKLGKCDTGPTCVVQQETLYEWVCKSDEACTSLKLNVRTSYTGPETKKKYRTRVYELEIPGRSLVSRADISFDCTSVGMVVGIDYKKLNAICKPITGQTMADGVLPAQTIGPETTRDPGGDNCDLGGLGSIGYFGSQTSCLPMQSPSREPASSFIPVLGTVAQPPSLPRVKKAVSAFVISAKGVTFGANGSHTATLNYDYQTGQFQCVGTLTSFNESSNDTPDQVTTGNFSSDVASCSSTGASASLSGSCDSTSGGDNDFCIGVSYTVTATTTTSDGCGVSIRIRGGATQDLSFYVCE